MIPKSKQTFNDQHSTSFFYTAFKFLPGAYMLMLFVSSLACVNRFGGILNIPRSSGEFLIASDSNDSHVERARASTPRIVNPCQTSEILNSIMSSMVGDVLDVP
jgi:hypothetical protein